MSENTKEVLAAVCLAIIIVAVLWILFNSIITALVICAIYIMGRVFGPLRFWRFLKWAGIGILRLFRVIKN